MEPRSRRKCNGSRIIQCQEFDSPRVSQGSDKYVGITFTAKRRPVSARQNELVANIVVDGGIDTGYRMIRDGFFRFVFFSSPLYFSDLFYFVAFRSAYQSVGSISHEDCCNSSSTIIQWISTKWSGRTCRLWGEAGSARSTATRAKTKSISA